MLLPRRPQLFTAMLDYDTDDSDRNDRDIACSNSNVEHVTMKEQARQQRAQAATEWQAKTKAAPPPLFGPPIQRRYSNDPIHQQCNSVLGKFDEARPLIYSASAFGITCQSSAGQGRSASAANRKNPLPLPSDKSTSSAPTRPNGLNRNANKKRTTEPMQGIFDKFDVSETGVNVKNEAGVVNVKRDVISPNVTAESVPQVRTAGVKPMVVKKEPEITVVKKEAEIAVVKKEAEIAAVVVKKEAKAVVKPVVVKKERTGKELPKGASNSKGGDKSSHHTNVSANERNDADSAKRPEDRHKAHTPVTPKRFQSPKRIPQLSCSSQGLVQKPSAKLHNGIVNGMDEDDVYANDKTTKVRRLKLNIPDPNETTVQTQGIDEDPVEEVFREMRLHPPLTAIDTPCKEKKFPFNLSTKESAIPASPKLLTKRKSHDGSNPAKVRRVSSVGNLEKDLVLSSDSDSDNEQESPTSGAPSGKVVAGKDIPISSLNAIGRAVLRSTSTKMSSETSDSESSDDDDASNSSNSDDDAVENAVKPEVNKKSGREETGGAGTMASKWNLENFIPKEKVGGILTESASSTPLANMSASDAHHLDELCHNIINNSDFLKKSPLSPLDTLMQRRDYSDEIKKSPLLSSALSQTETGSNTTTPKRNGEFTPKGSSENKRDSGVKRDLFNTPRSGKAKKDSEKKRSVDVKVKRAVSLSPAKDKSRSASASRRRSTEKKQSSVSKPRHAGKRVAGKSPRSKEFLSSSDSSDSDETSFVDVVGMSSPEKDRTAVCRSGKVVAKVEPKCSPKTDVLSLDLKDVFAAPLLSPIPNTDIVPGESIKADVAASDDASCKNASPSKLGVSYVDGRPRIMVRLKCFMFKTESPESNDEKCDSGGGVAANCVVTCSPVDSPLPLRIHPKVNDGTHQATHDVARTVPSEKSNDDKSENASMERCDPANDTSRVSGCAEKVVNDAGKPSKPPGVVEKKRRPMPVDIIAQFSNGDGHRPLPKMKIPKRKPEVSRESQHDGSKRPRANDTSASSPTRPSDDVTDQESTSHKDDHAWDRKHPRRSDRPPAGSTSSSISSQHSQGAANVGESRYGSRSLERDRSSHRDGRDWEHHKSRTDWDAPSDVSESQGDSPTRYRSGGGNHGNQYQKVGSDWGAMVAGQLDTSYPERHPTQSHSRGSYSPYAYRHTPHHTRDVATQMSPKHKCCHRVAPMEDKLRSAADYLDIAKKLKHQADSTTDALAKFLTYINAGIYFIQWCFAEEREHANDTSRIFTMYNDTLKLIKHKYTSRASHEPGEIHDKEAKLTVLSLRMQSILCIKLFQLKRVEMIRLKKVIDEYKMVASKPSHAQVPSPYQNNANWSRTTTGTPSPMSPQQSPAGSVGSVSSVGSGCGEHAKMMNGSHNSSGGAGGGGNTMGQAMVSVPQRVHSVTQQYLGIMNYLNQSHDIWDQADQKARDHKAFFSSLNTDCGPLTIQSTITEFARYIKVAVQRIKGT